MRHFPRSGFIAGLLTVLSLVALIHAAPLIPRETFQPRTFAATGWSGDPNSMGLRIFFPLADKTTIQELASVNNQPNTEWTRGSLLSSGGAFEISPTTPMSSSNVNGFIRVFFYDTGDNLREFAWDGQSWKVGTLAQAVGSHAQKLTSAAWLDASQTINFSVFYVTGNGELMEGTQAGSGAWSFTRVGSGKAAGDGGMFARVWLDSGIVKKRIYYQDTSVDNSLRESTWNIASGATPNAWTDGAPNNFPLNPSAAMSLSGAVIPSDGQERVFVNPPSSQDIVEYTRGGGSIPQSWSPGTHKLPVTASAGAPLHAVGLAFNNQVTSADVVRVFSIAASGNLVQTKYMSTGRPPWSTFSSDVNVF